MALFDVEVPLAAGQLEQARERREQQQDSDDETLETSGNGLPQWGGGMVARRCGWFRHGKHFKLFSLAGVTWAVFDFIAQSEGMGGGAALSACGRRDDGGMDRQSSLSLSSSSSVTLAVLAGGAGSAWADRSRGWC